MSVTLTLFEKKNIPNAHKLPRLLKDLLVTLFSSFLFIYIFLYFFICEKYCNRITESSSCHLKYKYVNFTHLSFSEYKKNII